MLHESLTWATVLAKVYPAIEGQVKDREFLANMIEIHKNGTAAPTTPAPQNQGTSKRPKITPDKRKPVAFPRFANTPARRVLYPKMMQAAEMMPDLIETQPQTAVATNNTDVNKFQSADWVNINLATTREDNWICTRGTGISSYYSNPKKAVHTLFNWHKRDVSDSDLNNIKFIDSLKQPMQLAESIQRAFHTRGITLMRGYKEFTDVFACAEPETNPILIVAVAVAKVHKKHKRV